MKSNIANTLKKEEYKEAYDKNIEIISCFNNLRKIIDENSNEPFEITKHDKNKAEILIRNSIEYIEVTFQEGNYYKLICLKLFRLLFLPHENLDYDNLDEKIHDYQLVLKLLKNQLDIKEKNEYINKVMDIKKIDEWKKLLRVFFITSADLQLQIAIALKFSKSVVEMSDFLLLILKQKHVNDFDVKFDLIKLIDVPEKNIARDFLELFRNNTEYFYIDFKEGKISKIPLFPENAPIAINKIENKKLEPKPKKKKKQQNKKKKEPEEKKSIKNNDYRSKTENDKDSKFSEDITIESLKEDDGRNTTVSHKEEKPDNVIGKKQNEFKEKKDKENIEKGKEESQSAENNMESEEISQQSKIGNNKDGDENDIKQILNNLRNELQEQKNLQINQQEIQNKKIESLNQIIESQNQKIESQNQKI